MKTVKSFMTPLGVVALLLVSCQKKEQNTELTTTENAADIAAETAAKDAVETANATTISPSSTSNSDIDKMLDDYEKYVDQYIDFLKKASKGDTTAMAEYPELMQKAEDLDKSLEKSKDENNLSPEQLKRMMNIEQKMLNAAADMQSNQQDLINSVEGLQNLK